MISMMPIQIKVAIFVAIALLIGYIYYDIAIKPQKEITRLNEVITKQRELPTKIVNKINALDANKTQKEIEDVKKEVTIVRDSGVLIF